MDPDRVLSLPRLVPVKARHITNKRISPTLPSVHNGHDNADNARHDVKDSQRSASSYRAEGVRSLHEDTAEGKISSSLLFVSTLCYLRPDLLNSTAAIESPNH